MGIFVKEGMEGCRNLGHKVSGHHKAGNTGSRGRLGFCSPSKPINSEMKRELGGVHQTLRHFCISTEKRPLNLHTRKGLRKEGATASISNLMATRGESHYAHAALRFCQFGKAPFAWFTSNGLINLECWYIFHGNIHR